MEKLLIIDPIAFQLFGFNVHWYGIAYGLAFLSGMYLITLTFKKVPLGNIAKAELDSLFNWIILGVILGGRLGYVFFYNPSYYLYNPVDILKTWQGGMSFHGGLLGVIIAIYFFSRKNKVSFFEVTDRISPTACLGLFFGRLANFINLELYGRVTDSPLGIVFPNGGELPRHPSQLYEAFLEGLLLFIALNSLLYWRGVKNYRKYEISGLFLIGYGVFRFGVEYFREPDAHLQEGIFTIITMGQILCLPMLGYGIFLFYKSRKHLNIK